MIINTKLIKILGFYKKNPSKMLWSKESGYSFGF